MNKITASIVVASIVGGLLAGIPARADQSFIYSDDLSSTSYLNFSQTTASLNSGRVHVASGYLSSQVVSGVVAYTNNNIVSARMDVATYFPNGSNFSFYISNNNGARWMHINPGYVYNFDSTGNQLAWKVVISRQDAFSDPYLDAVNITYTVGNQSAQNYNSGSSILPPAYSDINSWLCGTLASLGLGCGLGPQTSYQPGTTSIFQTAPAANNNSYDSSNGSAGVFGSALTASLATAGGANDNDEVILAKVKNKDGIYAITGGKKRLIPTMDIFYDYGYKLDMVQEITQKDLDKFSRVKLVQAKGDKKPHYLTEGGMIRVIPNDKVFDSYGDRKEDIVTISKKEFNWYPQNQFVFLENPLNRDVYQLVDGGKAKRYLTPVAVRRMKLVSEQIAPINDTELSHYRTEKPIVM